MAQVLERIQRMYNGFVNPPSYIIVMGMTGSGKSTFISHLVDEKVRVSVGHGLSSSTTKTHIYGILPREDDNSEISLVDTPGFDDTKRSNANILETITDELARLWWENQRLVGVIFLHRITDVRLSSSAVKNMKVLQKMCGCQNYGRIAFVTTMWDTVASSGEEKETAERRQSELEEYWNDMFSGSLVMRHDSNTRQSAWRVVCGLREHTQGMDLRAPLLIQSELCELEKEMPETEAGRYVYWDLLGTEKQRELAKIQEAVKAATFVLDNKQAAESQSDFGVSETQLTGGDGREQGSERRRWAWLGRWSIGGAEPSCASSERR